MTPSGRLYLLRVCGAPLLLLLGLLLALPPEAQVRQQETGGLGVAQPNLGPTLEPPSILFSLRGSLVLACHPQLPGLPISTPRSTSPKTLSNLLLTLLVNIHLTSQTCSPQLSSYPHFRDPSIHSTTPSTSPTPKSKACHSHPSS